MATCSWRTGESDPWLVSISKKEVLWYVSVNTRGMAEDAEEAI